jgi:hypothetical protein
MRGPMTTVCSKITCNTCHLNLGNLSCIQDCPVDRTAGRTAVCPPGSVAFS